MAVGPRYMEANKMVTGFILGRRGAGAGGLGFGNEVAAF
jgi:hypothetical protein